MKERKVKAQTADEELIDVLSAISIASLRLAKRLQAAHMEEHETHRFSRYPGFCFQGRKRCYPRILK